MSVLAKTVRFQQKIILLILALLITFYSSQIRGHVTYASSLAKPNALLGVVLTVGAVLVVGKLVKDGIDDSISQANEAAKDRLEQARVEIERIIKLIEDKYQDNLDLTLESLDSFVGDQFTRVYDLMIQIQKELNRIVGTIEEAAINVIEQAATQLRESIDYIEKKIEKMIIVAAESGVWVVDNVWETIISVVALLFLAGLLLLVYFQGASILRSAELPSKTRLVTLSLFSLLLLGVGTTTLLWKPVRLFIMSRATVSLQERLRTNITPQIFDIFPDTLFQGREYDLKIVGSHLPNSKPSIKVGSIEVPVKSFSENFVVATISGISSNLGGVQPIEVQYSELNQRFSNLVEFIGQGPDLVIDLITVDPEKPVINQPFSLKARIRNQGSAVNSYSVEIQFGTTDIPASNFKDGLPLLKQGETHEIVSTTTFAKSGKFEVIARVTSSTPEETSQPNKENNDTHFLLEVGVPPPPNEPPTPKPPVCADESCKPKPPRACENKPYLSECRNWQTP